jgi:hypothetical protein
MTATNSGEWCLYFANNADGNESVKEIWRGTNDAFPNARKMSEIVTSTATREQIAQLSIQIIKGAPVSVVPNLLNILICNFWRSENVIDVRKLQELVSSSKRAVCGRVFKKGEIIWNCRQCGKDVTCVQCDQCFKKSNHVGHEVKFHRAGGNGGCCDCGDAEAWCKSGNCRDHSHESASELTSSDIDQQQRAAVDSLPGELLRGLESTLAGVLSLLTSYVTCSVRGYQHSSNNMFISSKYNDSSTNFRIGGREPITVRIHNDDIHTYDEVCCSDNSQQRQRYHVGSRVMRRQLHSARFCVTSSVCGFIFFCGLILFFLFLACLFWPVRFCFYTFR